LTKQLKLKKYENIHDEIQQFDETIVLTENQIMENIQNFMKEALTCISKSRTLFNSISKLINDFDNSRSLIEEELNCLKEEYQKCDNLLKSNMNSILKQELILNDLNIQKQTIELDLYYSKTPAIQAD